MSLAFYVFLIIANALFLHEEDLISMTFSLAFPVVVGKTKKWAKSVSESLLKPTAKVSVST